MKLWSLAFMGLVLSFGVEAGFLDFSSYEEAIPSADKVWEKDKDYALDEIALKAIDDGSIEQCRVINEDSPSWKFISKNKREETAIILVSMDDESYPCRYMAEHLERNDFAMASLEDVPVQIAKKFKSKWPIFYLNYAFYREGFYNTNASLGYLRHEEMHLWQRAHNPYLEKFMWNNDKSETTEFGKFIEGCTEYYFPTNGPGYVGYAERYEQWLELAELEERVVWLERACSGNYLDYWRLTWWLGAF